MEEQETGQDRLSGGAMDADRNVDTGGSDVVIIRAGHGGAAFVPQRALGPVFGALGCQGLSGRGEVSGSRGEFLTGPAAFVGPGGLDGHDLAHLGRHRRHDVGRDGGQQRIGERGVDGHAGNHQPHSWSAAMIPSLARPAAAAPVGLTCEDPEYPPTVAVMTRGL